MAEKLTWKQRAQAAMFGSYAATESSPHRRSPTTTLKNKDNEFDRKKRRVGAATIREEKSNSTLLQWIVSKHLDYVSRFRIQFRSGNAELDREVNNLLDWHGRKKNFDITRRHNRAEWLRMFETSKVVHGDGAGIMLDNGKMQGLQGDQINKPDSWGEDPNAVSQQVKERVTDHGLILGEYGEVEQYCICRRNKWGRLVYDHLEDADNLVFDGYFSEFNQTRGISPLISAVNDAIDLNDIKLYNKITLKLQSLFGIAVFRGDSGGFQPSSQEETDEEEDIQFEPEQINLLDLDANDEAKILQANTPGPDSQEFMGLVTHAVMLALDIPYTSYDSSKASFSARIGDRAEYEESAERKREKNEDILREVYAWRMRNWYDADVDGFASVVDNAGYTPEQIVRELAIIPAGTPWLDKLNQAKGDAMAVSMGVDNVPRIARRHGLDAYDIVREQGEFNRFAEEQGVPIFTAAGGQEAVQKILDEDTGNNEDNNNGEGSNNE